MKFIRDSSSKSGHRLQERSDLIFDLPHSKQFIKHVISDPGLMTNPLRDVRPEERPHGLDYPDPRITRSHPLTSINPLGQLSSSRLRKTRVSSNRRRMHLAEESPGTQGTTSGSQAPDYALTADLLAERTLDGLLAEHPGELIRTGNHFFI